MVNEDKPKSETTPSATTESSTFDIVGNVKIAAVPGFVVALLFKCVLYSLGFESGGIRGKSYAATMMSFADKYWIGKGTVSFLQSCGTGGLGMYFVIFLASTLLLGAVLTLFSSTNRDEKAMTAETVGSEAKTK